VAAAAGRYRRRQSSGIPKVLSLLEGRMGKVPGKVRRALGQELGSVQVRTRSRVHASTPVFPSRSHHLLFVCMPNDSVMRGDDTHSKTPNPSARSPPMILSVSASHRTTVRILSNRVSYCPPHSSSSPTNGIPPPHCA
jgi:hypothetical protein